MSIQKLFRWRISRNIPASPATSPADFYSLTGTLITGEQISFSRFRGQVLLIVNTASLCGFTSQYALLEELQSRFATRGFSVLGFPSNDFRKQDPGSNDQIREFCDLNFRITFPLFEKDSVRGPDKQPVYRFLCESSASRFQGDPGWNFVKFLVNRDGIVVNRFSSLTRPTSRRVLNSIERLLSEAPSKTQPETHSNS